MEYLTIAQIIAYEMILPPCHLPLSVSAEPYTAEAIIAAAEYAVAAWNEAYGETLLVWVGDSSADIMIRQVDKNERSFVGKWRSTGCSDACCEFGDIMILSGIHCRRFWRRVLVHELGHALGLFHEDGIDTRGTSSVMYPVTPLCTDVIPLIIDDELVSRTHKYFSAIRRLHTSTDP